MPDPLAITAAGARARDRHGKALTDKAASAVKGKWDKFRWDAAVERCRARVKKLRGVIQITGGTSEPAPLDDILTDLYILERPAAFGRFDIELLRRPSAESAAPAQT